MKTRLYNNILSYLEECKESNDFTLEEMAEDIEDICKEELEFLTIESERKQYEEQYDD